MNLNDQTQDTASPATQLLANVSPTRAQAPSKKRRKIARIACDLCRRHKLAVTLPPNLRLHNR